MFNKLSQYKSHRILRVGISFIIFFILINVFVDTALPSYNDLHRASEILLDENVCNFTEKDFREIENSIKNDEKPKIFLMGDSIGYGIGVKEEADSITGYLREFQPDYSVYNLSTCGSKPLDYYLWVSHLSKIDDNPENIYLIQYNYKWFNSDTERLEDRVSQKRVLFKFFSLLNEEMQEKLDFYPTAFENLQVFLEKYIPVSANKIKVFAKIFKEKSKEDLVKHLFFGKSDRKSFEYKSKHWHEKDEFKNFNCKIAYGGGLWDSENNFNYKIYLKTLDLLEENNLNAFVYLPAYNQKLIKSCITEDLIANINKFMDDAGDRDIISAEFVGGLDDKYFLDDMHLDAEGNAEFANVLSAVINDYLLEL